SPALSLPTVTLNGGTLNGTRTRTITTLNATSGTLGGANTTTISTAFNKTSSGDLGIDATTLSSNVDPNWTGGNICVENGADWQLTSGRTLTLSSSNGTLNCSTNGSRVDVLAGGSVVQTGGGPRTLTTPLDVDGSLDVQAGSLTLASAGAGTDAGSLTASVAGATLVVNASRTLAGSGSSIGGAGTIDV